MDLLRLEHFDRLESFVTYYQDEMDTDFRKEFWPSTAFAAFAVADPSLSPLLEEWVERYPDSFAAVAARGSYFYELGWYYRGNQYGKDTSQNRIDRMVAYHRQAAADFERALSLRSSAVAVHANMLHLMVTNGAGDPSARERLERALQHCELCFGIRTTYMRSLRPRWGGSFGQMESYAAGLDELSLRNPKLALLEGYGFMDAGWYYREDEEYHRAHQLYDSALQLGNHPYFLCEKANLLNREERFDEAILFLDSALSLAPQGLDCLKERHWSLTQTEDYINAGRDIELARQLDPIDPWIAQRVKWTTDMLRYQGQEASKSGEHERAGEFFKVALQLTPDDRDSDAPMGSE